MSGNALMMVFLIAQYLPIEDMDDPVRVFSDIRFMRDQHDRLTMFAIQRLESMQDR
jgi:hypothetical protein